MTYQRKVARQIRDMEREGLFIDQWIAYCDRNGKGFAQPDIYEVMEDKIILLECKLTQSDSAEAQAMLLYAPLLEEIYKRPVVGCQVFKNIRYETGRMVEGYEELEGKTGFWLWHNIGG